MVGPLGGRGRLILGDPLTEGAFLSDVLQELLIINRPTEFPRRPVSNGAAVRAGFAAHGDGQGRWNSGCCRRGSTIALVAVAGRLIARDFAWLILVPLLTHCEPPFF